MDMCYVLHADHGMNASTFSAGDHRHPERHVFGDHHRHRHAQRGPLHGGANEGVIKMLQEIGSLEGVDAYVAESLAQKRKIMGIGHRVYKGARPAGPAPQAHGADPFRKARGPEVDPDVERIASLMLEKKNLHANVDFYSATVYFSLRIPTDLFTPIFAIARTSGWTAMCWNSWPTIGSSARNRCTPVRSA